MAFCLREKNSKNHVKTVAKRNLVSLLIWREIFSRKKILKILLSDRQLLYFRVLGIYGRKFFLLYCRMQCLLTKVKGDRTGAHLPLTFGAFSFRWTEVYLPIFLPRKVEGQKRSIYILAFSCEYKYMRKKRLKMRVSENDARWWENKRRTMTNGVQAQTSGFYANENNDWLIQSLF